MDLVYHSAQLLFDGSQWEVLTHWLSNHHTRYGGQWTVPNNDTVLMMDITYVCTITSWGDTTRIEMYGLYRRVLLGILWYSGIAAGCLGGIPGVTWMRGVVDGHHTCMHRLLSTSVTSPEVALGKVRVVLVASHHHQFPLVLMLTQCASLHHLTACQRTNVRKHGTDSWTTYTTSPCWSFVC